MTTEPAVDEFLRHRPRLLGIAYRLLGSMWDAEDVVSEAMVRWLRVAHDDVREPGAYLTTMVSRIALDELKSARVTRQRYVGPWLPEPALTDREELGPLDTVELRESVSLATLHVMEQLTPPERGVFVLREAFDLPFAQIAEILDLSVDSTRQLFHRAQRHLAQERHRFDPDPVEHAALLHRFLDAVSTGHLDELETLLAENVVSYSDGGGRANAAVRPVRGRHAVLKFLRGIAHHHPMAPEVAFVDANGFAAARITFGRQPELLTVAVVGHRIGAIFNVINPEKLSYVDHQLTNRSGR